ncbi:MAG: amidohydrolase family protein [Deltaproteobacteria bacterium]|nr:amidohydrolase family protein [Deltaproteobacteria bacterium]
MWKGFKVMDADAHMHEPQYLWERYVEPAYRDQVPKVAFMDGAFMVYEPDGRIIPKTEKQPKLPRTAWADMEAKYGEQYRTWWSAETRLKDMDAHGWDVQVLLPTGNNGNFAYRVALKDAGLGAAMCRAYNNWCRDYCDADPKRLKFVAVLPGADTGDMVAEARRAVEELGAVSVRNPFLPEGRWLHEPEYDALWGLACELDFPISVHGEYRQRRFHPFAGGNRGNVDDRDMQQLALRGLDHALGFPCDNMATMGHFIFTGILDRFPRLRLGILESNVGWVPFWLGRMDEHTHGRNSVMGNAVERLPMLPSEYFKRQVTVTCDSDESALSYAVDHLGGENIAWNTDYPHPDAPRPEKALPDFDAQPISDEAKARILWDNAVTLFGPRILA